MSFGTPARFTVESPQDLRRVFKDHDPQIGDYIIVRRLPRREFLTDGGERRKFVPFEIAVIPADGGWRPINTTRKGKLQPRRRSRTSAILRDADLSPRGINRQINAPLDEAA